MLCSRPRSRRRTLKTLLIGVFLLVVVFTIREFSLVYGEPAQRMVPIIRAYRAAFGASGSRYTSAWDEADSLLETLSRDNSSASDEASAALLCYYLGEHTVEEMLENVVRRGPRELPYLIKYRRRAPVLLRVDLDLSLLDSHTRHLVLDEAIAALRAAGTKAR